MSDQESFDERPQCAACERELLDTYHLLNGAMICSECRIQIEAEQAPQGSPMGRFSKAIGFGLVGGAIGAAIYFAIVKFTGYEVALVAIAVGFLAGTGVRIGAAAKGGWLYQLLAVAITYAAIVSTYVPFVVEEIDAMLTSDALALSEGFEVPQVEIKADHTVWLDGTRVSTDDLRSQLAAVSETMPVVWYHREGFDSEAPPPVAEEVALAIEELDMERVNFNDAAFTEPMGFEEGMAGADTSAKLAAAGFIFVVAAASPFFGVTENLVGLAIIGAALYTAWSVNRREKLELEGPLEMGHPATL